MGVRVDLVDQILPRVLNSIITGLMDDDDDVRAVAADTLHPIASAVVSNPLGFEQLPLILTTLWGMCLFLLFFWGGEATWVSFIASAVVNPTGFAPSFWFDIVLLSRFFNI